MKFTIKRADITDIEAISSVLKPYSDDGIILKISREYLKENIEKFFIAKIKNTIAGVVSYYKYSDTLIEIRSLVVKKDYYKKGIGSALLRRLVDSLLKDFPNAKIFALTYNPIFFIKFNFIKVSKDSLPEKIWKDCQFCLNQEECGETALIYFG